MWKSNSRVSPASYAGCGALWGSMLLHATTLLWAVRTIIVVTLDSARCMVQVKRSNARSIIFANTQNIRFVCPAHVARQRSTSQTVLSEWRRNGSIRRLLENAILGLIKAENDSAGWFYARFGDISQEILSIQDWVQDNHNTLIGLLAPINWYFICLPFACPRDRAA